MLAFALKRTLVALLVAVTVSVISFTLLRLSGDLAQALAGPSATAADVIAVRKAYGLDQPIAVQYLDWASKAIHGDFGDSFFLKGPPRSAGWREGDGPPRRHEPDHRALIRRAAARAHLRPCRIPDRRDHYRRDP